MSNKIIVITGASKGIGRACALALSNNHSTIILIARDEKNLNLVATECHNLGAKTKVIALDLVDTSQVKKAVEQIIAEFGKIDVLINNAGIWDEQPFEEGDMEKWDAALDVNLKTPIHLSRYCLAAMPKTGAIIFIGSTSSKKSYAGGTNYCAAKFGLLGFANSLFEDIREKGIKVSTILPGLVNTSMHEGDNKLDSSKMIQAEDVAKTVEFILSMPSNVCPLEISLQPQQNPRKYY